MLKRLLLAAALLTPSIAFAADGVIGVTQGAGVNIVDSPDGSGNVIPHAIDCDRTTPTQCQNINSSGQAAIQAPPSLPLPTGAATSSNQEVTAAGSSASSAQAVQGVTGGVALPVSASALPLPTGAATSANQHVTSAGSSDTSGQAVQGMTGGVALPVSATALPLPTGAATAANQTNAQGTAGSPGSTATTVQGIGGGTPVPVNLAATTSGGCTPYHLSGGTTTSNNANNIKSSAGNLCSLLVFNDGTGSATAVDYIKLYNLSSSPTCSSATGLVHVFPISVSATVGGFIWSVTLNESYSAGIGYCVVSTGADTGNGNATTGIYVEASYK